jgi:hypothetical protein
MTMQTNGVHGKSTFRRAPKSFWDGRRAEEIATPRFVLALTNGRELVVYAENATAAQNFLVDRGFDAYVQAEGGLAKLVHHDVSHQDVLTVVAAGGLRRDGTYDFGGPGTKLIADNNPAREAQQGKPALK